MKAPCQPLSFRFVWQRIVVLEFEKCAPWKTITKSDGRVNLRLKMEWFFRVNGKNVPTILSVPFTTVRTVEEFAIEKLHADNGEDKLKQYVHD